MDENLFGYLCSLLDGRPLPDEEPGWEALRTVDRRTLRDFAKKNFTKISEYLRRDSLVGRELLILLLGFHGGKSAIECLVEVLCRQLDWQEHDFVYQSFSRMPPKKVIKVLTEVALKGNDHQACWAVQTMGAQISVEAAAALRKIYAERTPLPEDFFLACFNVAQVSPELLPDAFDAVPKAEHRRFALLTILTIMRRFPLLKIGDSTRKAWKKTLRELMKEKLGPEDQKYVKESLSMLGKRPKALLP